MGHTFYYTRFESSIGRLGLFATDKGVCGLSFHEKGFQRLMDRLSAAFGNLPQQRPERFQDLIRHLKRYFQGDAEEFPVERDLVGITPFQRKVLKALQEIPYGDVRSYQWIARRIDQPRAVRAVGGACGANPLPLLIPCHRVISKDGSLGGFQSGREIKERLLQLEQVNLPSHRGSS
jgi:O-6-methylguanine DNA methyltransferase